MADTLGRGAGGVSGQRNVGDLSPAERDAWMADDPAGFHQAVHAWARQVAEAELRDAIRRQFVKDLRTLGAPFRWVWRLLAKWGRGHG